MSVCWKHSPEKAERGRLGTAVVTMLDPGSVAATFASGSFLKPTRGPTQTPGQAGSQEMLFAWCWRTGLLCPPAALCSLKRPVPLASPLGPPHLHCLVTAQAPPSWPPEPASPLASPSAPPQRFQQPEALAVRQARGHRCWPCLVLLAESSPTSCLFRAPSPPCCCPNSSI